MDEPARLQLFGVPTLVPGGAGRGVGQVLPFERRSQLLVLLALRGGWVARAEAAAMLWPDQQARLAHANLRKTLFRLPALGWGALVRVQGGALRFDGTSDVAVFEAALQEQRLGDALAHAGGDILARGFDDDANEAWTTWLGFERERLRMAWRGAALGWLEALPPDQGAPAALTLAARLLEADPLDEVALRAQIRWLLLSGQGAAARQAHARFVQRLEDELGIAPGAALVSLGESLRESSGESPGSGPALAPASAPARVPARSAGPALPLPSAPGPADDGMDGVAIGADARGTAPIDTGFIGRGAELRHIASLLEQDDCRLLTLLGPGGVGKTRLAYRALQELEAGFAQGGAFVALEDVADEAGIGAAFARALALRADDPGDPLASVITGLRERRMLLVLDNFEQLLPAAGALRRLLDGCPGLKLLVTTRVRLALPGEWVFALEGLPCPDPEDLDRIEAFDAVRVFVRAARRVVPRFVPQAEAAAIAEICAVVEGLPLALELAAGWVRVLSCADIAGELRAGVGLLLAEDGSLPRRHASIEQVFDQSWQRLSNAERELLARLAVFHASFTPAAARMVAGATLPVLGALVDKSLLRKEGTRLRLHPLVQQLALARLDDDERRATADAHAAHYLHELARRRRQIEVGERDVLQQLDAEGANFRAAWRQAAGAGAQGSVGTAQARLLADAALALVAHADHRGQSAAGLALADLGLEGPAAAKHPGLRAVLLGARALLEHRLGRDADAEASARRALDEAKAPADYDAQLMALKVLGLATMRLGRLDEARTHHEAALRLAGLGSDPHNAALLLGNQALVERRAGRHAEAQRLLLQALQEHRRLGDHAREARLLNNLAAYLCDLREFEAARIHLHEARSLCERHGLQGTLGMVLGNLCFAALEIGDLDAAATLAPRALEQLERAGDRGAVCSMRHTMAMLALRRGENGVAADELAASMRLAQELAQPGLKLLGLVVFAQWLAAGGEPDLARVVLRFADAHEAAAAHVRKQVRHTLAGLPDGDAPLPQGAGPALDELVARIVAEAPLGFAALRATLRESFLRPG